MGSKPSPEPKILYMTPEKGLDKILELTLAAQNRPFQLPRGCQDEGEQAHVGLSDQLLARGARCVVGCAKSRRGLTSGMLWRKARTTRW
jgi:hypothetical protein